MANILKAIKTIVENPIPDIVNHYRHKSNNRINAVGEALEEFVKDIFSDTVYETDQLTKIQAHSQLFSYIGNQNNPPDLIIRGGDAIEVKKIQSFNSAIALNSSYPKSKLFQDSPMITSACRQCENWTEKDIIYTIGVIKNINNTPVLSTLWLIYGDCYAASKEIYERIRQKIAIGITQIPDVEFIKTKELGKVNKVDPLGITDLRIRGMWGIANPLKVFNYLNLDYDNSSRFHLIALMRESKYNSFSQDSKNLIESISTSGFQIQNHQILSPDNPALLIPAKIISYKLL